MRSQPGPAHLSLFGRPRRLRKPRYVPTYDHYPPEVLRHTQAVVDELLARRGEPRQWKWCPGMCGRTIHPESKSCSSPRCPLGRKSWLGRARKYLRHNLAAHVGPVAMVTLTSPGVHAGAVWDEDACAHLGPHKHSGELGCLVASCFADPWNETASKRARELHRVARNYALKAVRRAGFETAGLRMLCRAWEDQKRGLAHLHRVFPYGSERERIFVRAYHAAIELHHGEHGFGRPDSWASVEQGISTGEAKASTSPST